MSQDALPPFIKWGSYKSTDEKNPDILELKVVETDTFETEYSTNVRVQLKKGTNLKDVILPLKSHNSTNVSLLNKWNSLAESGKIKQGTKLTLKTWLGTSRYSKRPIRRFAIKV